VGWLAPRGLELVGCFQGWRPHPHLRVFSVIVEAFSEKNLIQMITLIDLSRLWWQWKAKTKSKKITT
jgi:hypothetical protein